METNLMLVLFVVKTLLGLLIKTLCCSDHEASSG